MNLKEIKLGLASLLLLVATQGRAETVIFGDDELPAESVVPILDSAMAVKGKAVPFTGRLEVGLNATSIIDEMFFNNSLYGVNLFYSMNEEIAWGLKYSERMSGLSEYSDQFKATSTKPDLGKAPAPTSVIAGSYRWTFLYGKVSLSKDLVLPTVISTEFDFGVNKVGGQSLPLAAIGITHKVYMHKQIGLGFTYRIMAHQTFDSVSTALTTGNNPSESDFDKKIQISQSFDLGVSYLF